MVLKHQIIDDDKSSSASELEDECFQEEQNGEEYHMRRLLDQQQIREEALKYIANCEISEDVVSQSDENHDIEEEEEEVQEVAENTRTNITTQRHNFLKDLLRSYHGEGSASPPQQPTYDCHSEGIAGTSQPEATASQKHNWWEHLEKHEDLPLGSLKEPKGKWDKSKWGGRMEGIFGKFTNLIRKQQTPKENNMAEVDKNISEIYKQSRLRAKLESDRKINKSSKEKQCWSQLTCCQLDVEVIKSSIRKQRNEDWKSYLEEYISSDTW